HGGQEPQPVQGSKHRLERTLAEVDPESHGSVRDDLVREPGALLGGDLEAGSGAEGRPELGSKGSVVAGGAQVAMDQLAARLPTRPAGGDREPELELGR